MEKRVTKPIKTKEKCLVVFGFILLSIVDWDGDERGHRVSFVVLWKTCTRKMQEEFWYARRECGDRMFNFPEENCSSRRGIPGANQNYSTYVTMIHRRYKRLQHKCSPFLQVLHKRTKCLVYKRIENPGSLTSGIFNSENKAGRRSLVRWPIQLIGSMTKISTLD